MSELVAPSRDAFYWYCRMDMATAVAAHKTGIITPDNAAQTAQAISAVIAAGDQPGADRPTDYLGVQAMLLQAGGPEASRMHSGRSRQCMLATLHRLFLRDRALAVLGQLHAVRAAMLRLGFEYAETLVPAYTNGVQAQPVTFGHLLSGYEAALQRSGQRLVEGYKRLNLSPLGAAALAASRFPVDRPELAALLGFDGCVENTFDAAQIAVVDVGVEMAQCAALIALSLGTFIQDVHAQFHHARNWLFIDDANLLSPSTLMPHKRNPVVLNRARLLGSQVLGAATTAALAGHNVCSGLTDYKRFDAAQTLDLALSLMAEVLDVLRGLRLDPEAALAEIGAEYTTTSELAAALQDEANVPLAVGHRFASLLVDEARRKRTPLSAMPYERVAALYAQVVSEADTAAPAAFPLSDGGFKTAVDPQTMVNGYRGLGGSAPAEVWRMLTAAQTALDQEAAWLQWTTDALATANRHLDAAFHALRT